MAANSSAIELDHPLRSRMHVLKRAHSTSLSSLNTGSTTSANSKGMSLSPLSHTDSHLQAEETAQSSPTDYETRSESSDDVAPEGSDADVKSEFASLGKKSRPRTPIDDSTSPTNPEHSHPSPDSTNTRAWYEFDLAVVVALVSPIGNWLTGGDHIKNLLLIIFLIFYLHQIIEVPWALYQKARPRRRPPHLPAATADERYKEAATSELHAIELFFLSLTALSPFLGATFLRYTTASIMGEEAVSWFSTGLFILATGMRPWSHVIERFNQRTSDLHDVIHYPSPNRTADDMNQRIEETLKRVEHLEKSLSKVKHKLSSTTEEVYDYVDEVVDTVEKTVRRQERKHDKHEIRVKDVEEKIASLKALKGKQRAHALTLDTKSTTWSILSNILPSWLVSPPHHNIYSSTYHSPSTTSKSLRSFPSPSLHLETIPEEEAANYSLLAQPSNLASIAMYRAGYIATLPLRAVVRMVLRKY